MNTENAGSDYRPPRKRVGRPIRITLGVIFFILGVIGSLLPILQGWLFFLLCIAVLFPEHPRVVKVVRKADDRTPRLARVLRKMGIGVEDEVENPGPDDDDEQPSRDTPPGYRHDEGVVK